MFHKISTAFHWMSAVKFWRLQKYEKALAALERVKINNLYQTYVLTMRAVCCHHLGKTLERNLNFEKAKKSLDVLALTGQISEEDAKYLLCYIKLFEGKLDNLSLDEVRLNLVSNRLKRRFPLEMHSNWEQDEAFHTS